VKEYFVCLNSNFVTRFLTIGIYHFVATFIHHKLFPFKVPRFWVILSISNTKTCVYLSSL